MRFEVSIPELARHAGLDVQAARRAEDGEPIPCRSAQSIAEALSKGMGSGIQVKDINGLNVRI